MFLLPLLGVVSYVRRSKWSLLEALRLVLLRSRLWTSLAHPLAVFVVRILPAIRKELHEGQLRALDSVVLLGLLLFVATPTKPALLALLTAVLVAVVLRVWPLLPPLWTRPRERVRSSAELHWATAAAARFWRSVAPVPQLLVLRELHES